AGAAVHDEIVGPFRYLRVQVVHEHAQGGLLDPAFARPLWSPRRAHRSRTAHGAPGSNWASRMPTATRSISAVSGRSPVSGGAMLRSVAYLRATPRPGRRGLKYSSPCAAANSPIATIPLALAR